jgi:hypothetical protein
MPGQKPGGLIEITGPYGVETQHASTCAHCQKVSTFASLRAMHEHVDVCRSCMKLICSDCAGKPCRPWEKEMERQEARGRFLRDVTGHQ